MRWLTFILLTCVLLTVQSVIVPRMTVLGAGPDLLLIFAIFLALFGRPREAILGAWLLGIAADLLSIERFGLMAITMALLGVLSVVADFGISRGIIHFDHVDQRTRSSLYWLGVGVAGCLSLLVLLSAPFIARIYANPALAPVLAWTAPILLVTSLGQQFIVFAEKELEFSKPAQNEIASSLTGFVACVVAAVWLNAGVFALVAVMGLFITACATHPDESAENSPEEMAAAKLVLEQLKPYLGDAYPTGLGHFEMGMLDEGCAVLLVRVNNEPVNAAFWTYGDKVYAVNLAARWMNETLEDAPRLITEDRVRAVVH